MPPNSFLEEVVSMPTYTYRCENCGNQFDRYQSFDDEPLKVCPECRKHSLHKVYFPVAVAFKGSGFYVTDKGKNGAQPAGKVNGKSETKAESKDKPKQTSETKATTAESKPAETKKDS